MYHFYFANSKICIITMKDFVKQRELGVSIWKISVPPLQFSVNQE